VFLSQARTWISNVICRGPSICLVNKGVVDYCSFCWYWWIWWPSLFKLYLHNNTFTYRPATTICLHVTININDIWIIRYILYKRHSQLLTLCFVCLRFVYLMLSVFLYSTFLIAPLVSSHIYCVPIRSQDLDFQRHMS
jgi:hypothetical protein